MFLPKINLFFSLNAILPARVPTHQLQPSRTRSWSSPFALFPAMVLLTSFRPPRATASSPPPACRAHATASLLAARALAAGSSLAARAHATSPPPTRPSPAKLRSSEISGRICIESRGSGASNRCFSWFAISAAFCRIRGSFRKKLHRRSWLWSRQQVLFLVCYFCYIL